MGVALVLDAPTGIPVRIESQIDDLGQRKSKSVSTEKKVKVRAPPVETTGGALSCHKETVRTA